MQRLIWRCGCGKQWDKEISLDYLMYEKFVPFSTTDDYFKKPEPCEEYTFSVCGQMVVLYDEELAAALSLLPEQGKEKASVLLPA